MNHLVHLYLSDPDPLCRLGNLVGDYVKGPLAGDWPPRLRHGLRQHRRVDAFAQDDPAFRRSKRRLDARFGHGRGVLVDVFYDHLLACEWEQHCRQPLAAFAGEIYADIETHLPLLPAAFRRSAPGLIARDWLVAIRDPEVVGRVLASLAGRLRRPLPLAAGAAELEAHRAGLAADCRAFLAGARRHLQTFTAPE